MMIHLHADLLRLCFGYLDAQALVVCETVSHEWQTAARDPSVWRRLYCSVWRHGVHLPSELEAEQLTYDDWKRIYRQRSSVSLTFSTRGPLHVTADQTVVVVSSGTSHFRFGCIESICGVIALEPLAISRLLPPQAKALHSDVCYFETRLNDSGSVGFVALPPTGAPPNYGYGKTTHVGWLPVSYGYHSDDGHVFWNHGVTEEDCEFEAFGPRWGDGEPRDPDGEEVDTIGCGIDRHSGQLFFTKNGVFLGFVAVQVDTAREYAAAVTMCDRRDTVEINVGRKAFEFDFEAFIARGAVKSKIPDERFYQRRQH